MDTAHYGHEMTRSPEMRILSPSITSMMQWSENQKLLPIGSISDLPDQCYAFMKKCDYPPADGRRERLLRLFNVPEFVASRTCFELNGFSGYRASFDETTERKHVTSCTTWFRYLVKMVRKISAKDLKPSEEGDEYAKDNDEYIWFEMTVFTCWDYPDKCRVLCVDIPPDCSAELQMTLQKRATALDFRDPFAMHADLVDRMIIYSDIAVWRVRDPVRVLEKSRLRMGQIFEPIHDISRHAIHISEVLEAAVETLTEIRRFQEEIHADLFEDLGKTYKQRAREYAQFQLSLVKNMKLRSDSSMERLKNEVNLAFNNIARQDNSVMKSIALLTMIFLPATFFSALFSTTFFSFDNNEWKVSSKLWVYWATIVPATIIIVILWRVWLASSDRIAKFLGAGMEWVKDLWKRGGRAPKPGEVEDP
ncbi:hypothetical protein B0T22DRAFT_452698 [Podospora appendiculata]|uniref:Uncharacterized protein n=1 Tax=Podospora appendiculata TaxID=314037 RepID=A0AAE0XJB7_9PEZI|nr:hypothetical protein B0T22DRAFT_452698 [Podospora appendiculata]